MDREIPRAISENQNPEALRTVSAVYNAEADLRRNTGHEAGGRKLVGEIAAFKSRSIRLVKKREKEIEDRKRRGLHAESFLFDGQFLHVADFEIVTRLSKGFMRDVDDEPSLLLAVDKKKRKACYIV